MTYYCRHYMTVQNPHTVTDQEIKAIETLGYSINSPKNLLKDFLKTHFPGLMLQVFLTSIDLVLTPLTEQELERQLSYEDGDPPTLTILMQSENWTDDNEGLAILRTFSQENGELIVKHNFFRLPALHRNKGIGKRILSLSLQQYECMNVNKILVDAALEDGGFVWAKAGFTAINKTEVDVILNASRLSLNDRQFSFVKRIYDRYYTSQPNGKSFPMEKWSKLDGMDVILRGSQWSGEIDLHNTEVLANFKYYVA